MNVLPGFPSSSHLSDLIWIFDSSRLVNHFSMYTGIGLVIGKWLKVSVFFCSIVPFDLSFVTVLFSRFGQKDFKKKCPTVLISVHLFVFPSWFPPAQVIIFLPVLYLCWDDDSFSFRSFLPLLLVSHTIPACSFPKTLEMATNGSFNPCDFCPSVCSVLFFSPYPCPATHTLPNLDTGQVGGVYHSMMSLMDSVLSVMDSWDCRKKDECCAQCSCLVCRNPQLY